MADVIHDITTIAELQAKLILVDSKLTLRRCAFALVLGAVGFSLLLGSIPIVLLATTELLVVRAEMGRWLALTTSAGLALVVASILVTVAWYRLRKSAKTLEPSKNEFIHNLEWMKRVLKNRGCVGHDASFATTQAKHGNQL